MPAEPRPRRRYVTFAIIAVLVSTVFSVLALLGVDFWLHKRYEKRWGLNVWGYRGEVVGRKQTGEFRLVVVGGSTALGFGLPAEQAFPGQLQRLLKARPGGAGAVSVVNLAYNAEGAYSFAHTLRDYDYLAYDAALLYTGVNDLGGPNRQVFRRDSGVFRLTGYYFMLPQVLRERALFIRYGGDMDAAARGEKVVFTPNARERTAAAALEAAAKITRSIENQLGQQDTERTSGPGDSGCGARWDFYCGAVARAVEETLARGRRVIVVSEPYVTDVQADQQRALAAMLQRRFAGRPGWSHVDLGRAVDVREPAIAFDGMHLTGPGNAIIAARLVEPVTAAMDRN
ncbi:MAG: SGNH/GDSL hydrolase family protein [Candidatus Rokubacteria bacterium]|nr:SGNH/GDSL hydrolase family protein [Candidatus Rokubacteria bacterium]MBI3825993.1 SGNH/GDSL hydrolase family protein [Candidatus Rokubacteria bacterium]